MILKVVVISVSAFGPVLYLNADEGCFSAYCATVKSHGPNADSAKKSAMAEAFRLAFLSLLKKSLGLSAVAAAAISDQVSDKRLADSVFDYSVENEKYSDSHYMVKVSCRFSRSVIGALLKSIGWVPEIAPDGSTSSGNVSVPDSSATIAVKLAVYLDDFICHFHELNELNCRVIGLLPRVAIFVLDSSCLGEFCALGIRYAYVTAQ